MDTFLRNFISRHYRLIKKTHPDYLLKLLSAIEYTEAILEITASKIFGDKLKWFIVFLTHLTKFIIRLQLLIIHKIGMQTLPSLFNTKAIVNSQSNNKQSDNTLQLNTPKSNDLYFKLGNSGRVIRTIKNSPTNLEDRDWSLPIDVSNNGNVNKMRTQLSDDASNEADVDFDPTKDNLRFLAELFYISRPLCHLSCIVLFSSKSWTQFMIPLILDTSSLFLMNGTKKLSKSQKKEMKRRTLLFLHYFIRSPFYESCSGSLINVTLTQFEQRIPGMKFLIKPIKEYIPYWRSIYNYCWTS